MCVCERETGGETGGGVIIVSTAVYTYMWVAVRGGVGDKGGWLMLGYYFGWA